MNILGQQRKISETEENLRESYENVGNVPTSLPELPKPWGKAKNLLHRTRHFTEILRRNSVDSLGIPFFKPH